MRRAIVLMLLVVSIAASACTRGRPVKIVHADQSTIVGTLIEMRPDAVDLETANGVLVSEPRAGIASITAPSEVELASLRANGTDPGNGHDAGIPANGGPSDGGPADGGPANGGRANGGQGNGGPTSGGANGAGGIPGDRGSKLPADGGNATSNVPDHPNAPPNAGPNAGPRDRLGVNGATGANGVNGPSGVNGGSSVSPSATGVVIPAGTSLVLLLETPLDSTASRAEQRVDATLATPVMNGRTIALPAGTRVRGDVTESVSSKQAGGRGRLGIRFHTIILANGNELRLAAAPVRFVAQVFTRGDAKKTGIGAAAGAVIGGLFTKTKKGLGIGAAAGGGATAIAVSRNNEMRLDRGARVTVRVDEAIPLPAR